MKINYNIPALKALNFLNKTNRGQTISMERLSSGLKISSSKNDPAGMAISKKMDAQIDSLRQANRNSLDGISLIQTAEGALNEVHDITKRIRELTIQSANETLNNIDREKIQVEVDQLVIEIDRISNETEFNEIKVLQGECELLDIHSFESTQIKTDGGEKTQYRLEIPSPSGGDEITIDGTTFKFYDSKDPTYTPQANDIDIHGDWRKAMAEGERLTNYTINVTGEEMLLVANTIGPTGANGEDLNLTDPITEGGMVNGNVTSKKTNDGINSGSVAEHELRIITENTLPIKSGTGFTIDGIVFEFYDPAIGPYEGTAIPIELTGDAATDQQSLIDTITAQEYQNFTLAHDTTITNTTPDGIGAGFILTAKQSGTDGDYLVAHNGGTPPKQLFIQTGAYENQLTSISLASSSSDALGLTSKTPKNGYTEYLIMEDKATDDAYNNARYGISILNVEDADYAIKALDKAIAEISAQRAYMGAAQNRLEYTVKNLDVFDENITSALSRIRDTDMASEMTEYTKNNILMQSATSMIAQANQQPQQVFQLLQQ